MKNAFLGIENLYTKDGLNKIAQANFLVIGIGGVGSWICEALARSGAQFVTLVDLDDICVSNINRQVQTHTQNIGKFKIDEMKLRMQQINPQIQVTCIHDFFSESSCESILNQKYDFIFDAIDSMKSKCILIDACKKKQLPLICSGGSGGKTDPTCIEIRDLNRTINDPLLFRVRKNLRKNYNFRRYHDHPYKIPTVFSTQLPQEIKSTNCSPQQKINCQSGLGSASFVTGGFAFAMVSYVLGKIVHAQDD